jgi:hypothetical protein
MISEEKPKPFLPLVYDPDLNFLPAFFALLFSRFLLGRPYSPLSTF